MEGGLLAAGASRLFRTDATALAAAAGDWDSSSSHVVDWYGFRLSGDLVEEVRGD